FINLGHVGIGLNYNGGNIGNAFNYVSYNPSLGDSYPMLYPQLYQIVLAIVAFFLLSFLEAGMVSAFSVLSVTLHNRTRIKNLWVIRLLPVLGGAGLMVMLAELNFSLSSSFGVHFGSYYWTRIIENLQVTASTLIDGGIMTGANLLRPTLTVRFYYVIDALSSYIQGGVMMAGLTWGTLRLTARIMDRD
ncbi:MAG TPA: hypothetical protein VHL11_11935, partial [Phototrophicaceae bacterium]|nr:hypothetical protein [Phototrophicaceae bacterium]